MASSRIVGRPVTSPVGNATTPHRDPARPDGSRSGAGSHSLGDGWSPGGDPVRSDEGQRASSTEAPGETTAGGTRPTQVICVANQKGGVGKTTTAVSLGAALAEAGGKVLLVDLDPQGNATTGLGLRAHQGDPSSYTVVVDEADPVGATLETPVDGLDCLPSSLDLAGAEIELVPTFSREQRLRDGLDKVRGRYDLVIIDCPPSLGLLTINALAAADQVLLPIQCEYYALEGVGQLTRGLDLVRGGLNPDLELGGVLLTMYDARTRLSEQVADEVRAHFREKVFRTVIPRTVRLSEAPGFGEPITTFDPSSRGARAYFRLADEVAQRLGLNLRSLSPLDAITGRDEGRSGSQSTPEPAAEAVDESVRKDQPPES